MFGKLRYAVLAVVISSFPIAALADISGTATLAANARFNFDTGATVTSGGDILFSGTAITPQGSATAYDSGTTFSSFYDSISQSLVMTFAAQFNQMPISPLAVNHVIGVHTNGGNYAKVLITAVSSSSLTFQYTTFGVSGGGGGGAGGPMITELQNNYSYALPGLPNYGIAQGCIFIIKGSMLANASTPLTSPPPTNLQGVSVSVTVNGVTTTPLLYYVTPGQLGAILPSATPVGTGTITVTNNQQTSQPAPITVVQAAFGILTLNGGGTGPAAAFDAAFPTSAPYLGYAAAANPGDTITLWGSGTGPVPDDTKQSAVNVPNEVDIGGISATVTYYGRSGYPGLDQINVVVPQGVTPGCYVSVVVRSGSPMLSSNFATIPVAAQGRTCSDPTLPINSSEFSSLLGKSSVAIGFLDLGKLTTSTQAIGTTPASTTTSDSGFGEFIRETLTNIDPYIAYGSTGTVASIGSCVVYTYSSSGQGGSGIPNNPYQTAVLDAGPSINVTGPNGMKSMSSQNGFYFGQLGGFDGMTNQPLFIPAGGGAFTFDNGSGGKDVGAFTAHLNLAAPLAWTNMNDLTTVTESQGATVTWTGGEPNSYVQISGASSVILTGNVILAAVFYCNAPVSAGSFTVPAAVLQFLPPTTYTTIGSTSFPSYGSLEVYNYSYPVPFTAPGLDAAWITAYSANSNEVIYK